MSDNTKTCAHKEDILKAAIAEFGKVGYAAASTNEIVKNAKVSKGLLFHHFKNKEGLYKECQFYVLDEYAKYMLQRVDFSSPDIFERLLSNLHIKMEFGRKNPEFLSLINRVMHMEDEASNVIRSEADKMKVFENMNKKMADLFIGLDVTKLRAGMDLVKVMDFTGLILEASWVRYYKLHQNDPETIAQHMESFLAEAEEIIGVLKFGFYGEG